MRNQLLLFLLAFFSVATAQNTHGIYGDSNWFNGWTNFRPKQAEYNQATQILTGVISENTTLKRTTYLIMGTVYVANNATLTIEPGAVLRGDFNTNGTLVVTRGSKLIAEGTETNPIVFTSSKASEERKAGDWGGVILYGDAPLNRLGGVISSIYDSNPKYNLFGGNNEDSDAGILKYVRIEFAGKKINDNIMLNGLTLGAVGKKTKIEYVQISFAKDDAIEVVGGNIDMNNIISFRNADDDIDYSMGAQSQVSNSVIIRNPFISDNTRSRCFEIDSYDKLENFDPTKKRTVVKLKNVTMVNNEENTMGLVKEAISLKSDSYLEMERCLVVGFESFLALDDKYLDMKEYQKIKIYNSIIDSCTSVISNEALFKAEAPSNWFLQSDKLNRISNEGILNLFYSNNVNKKPDFRMK
ncbi:hypothetical protein [Flavobacterium luminosum]|uniref:T9SS C-terminal target domain-containing protein n=1 Tax=Flavobacterium luminosum TaxID=2949086 RepID=A0ABT0TKJ1_9FLAO|nr:hypothetical protein [Flavobacterium sp. HXWNR70]MCL9808009.1 hypothetical protein [Flavobacterium sp. HXWNR70]